MVKEYGQVVDKMNALSAAAFDYEFKYSHGYRVLYVGAEYFKLIRSNTRPHQKS